MPDTPTPLVGVAIAVHNSKDHLRACIDCLRASTHPRLHIVVCDDGSDDGTGQLLRDEYPEVRVVRGDGEQWWTGGTNRAVELCLVDGCDYVLLLNPDVFVTPQTIAELVAVAEAHPGSIAAALVLDRSDTGRVLWAGSRWGRVAPGVPVWTSRYLYKRGSAASSVPGRPYPTDEVHGRAVLIPASVLRHHGLHDDLHLPHYGADTEFSLRVHGAGVEMRIVPSASVTLDGGHTGIGGGTGKAWSEYWRYLTDQKRGQALYTWQQIVTRHVPWYGQLPTWSFVIGLNSYRYWRRVASQKLGGR